MPPFRAAFFGTAAIAQPALQRLHRIPGVQLACVVSQPDKPQGRDLLLLPTPVKATALQLGLPVLQPAKARSPEFLDQLRALDLAVIVVMAYGQILPQTLLDIPTHGCLNLHTSLLPRHRGAAPIQWTLLSGDPVTGVTLMKMDAGMDTGAIVSVRTTPVDPRETSGTLHDRLALLAADLLDTSLSDYLAGRIQPQPQDPTAATYTRKLSKDDGLLDWNQPAETLDRRIRALIPWPGAHTLLPPQSHAPPRLLKIWNAEPKPDCPGAPPGTVLPSPTRQTIPVACATGTLHLLEVQPENSRRMKAHQYLAGHPLPPGTMFASPAAQV